MNINFNELKKQLLSEGMNERRADLFLKNLEKDFISNPTITEEQKEWALLRGFYPSRIFDYKLN